MIEAYRGKSFEKWKEDSKFKNQLEAFDDNPDGDNIFCFSISRLFYTHHFWSSLPGLYVLLVKKAQVSKSTQPTAADADHE